MKFHKNINVLDLEMFFAVDVKYFCAGVLSLTQTIRGCLHAFKFKKTRFIICKM